MRNILNSYGSKNYEYELISLIFNNDELRDIEKAIEVLYRQCEYELSDDNTNYEYENQENCIIKYININNTMHKCSIVIEDLQFIISKCKILINQEERFTVFTFTDLLNIYLGIETIINGLHKQHFRNSLMQTTFVNLYDKSLNVYDKLKHEIHEVLNKSDSKMKIYGYFTTTEEILNKPLKPGQLPLFSEEVK